MSFGFGVGDFLAVIKLANDIRKDFANAPEQFQQINAEIRNLAIVLGDVEVSLAAHDVSEDQERNLREIRESCRSVLEDTAKVRNKYVGLESKGGSFHERTKRVWTRVKWEPDDVHDLRDRIISNIVALNSFTGFNIRDTVLRLKERQIQQESREILEWLTPLDTTVQQTDFIRQRQAGTGQWFLDTIQYKLWRARKGEILFCHGIPGAGKTILSSIVVEDLHDTFGDEADVAICCVYLNFKSQNEQTLEKVLLSLLKQLSQASALVPQEVQALFDQCQSKNSRPSGKEIMGTLSSVALSFSRVLIVVDALDECQASNGCQRELISHLIELQCATGASIMTTSRPVQHIMESFKDFTSLRIFASEGDIHRYIENNILNLPGFVCRDTKLQDEIKNEIAKAADGMFLLAKLHLDSLRGRKSPRQLRKLLSSLATGNDAYEEAYQDTMQRIYGQLPTQKELALDILMWVVYAKRPLTTIELRVALAVEVSEPQFFEDNMPDLDDMVSACCGLVTVDKESDVIRLIHYTAQEFLTNKRSQYFPDAERQITDVCVTYLAFDAFESGPCHNVENFKSRLLDFPFYGYSSIHWGQHADPQISSEIIQGLLARKNHVEACGQALMVLRDHRATRGVCYMRTGPLNMAGLHLAAYFGLVGTIAIMLDNDSLDPDIKDSKARTPMWYAAHQGRQEVVNQLLQRHCKPNMEDEHGQTPFLQAVRRGHDDIVRVLLVQGSQINHTDQFGWTPLSWAAASGNESIARMLLDDGAWLEHRDVRGRTPLFNAAQYGSEVIVRMLLNKGAQAEFEDRDGWTPLLCAASKNYSGIITLLLKHEDSANMSHPPAWTSFSKASSSGFAQLVETLINHGAEVNIRFARDGMTPLMLAARRGHLRVLGLLLKAGANHQTTDIYGRSALFHAIINNLPETVDVLLAQTDIDYSARDHWGSAAISFAAQSGNLALFRKIASLPKADLFVQDLFGRTPLWWVRRQGHDIIAKDIVAHQQSINRGTMETPALQWTKKPVKNPWTRFKCDVCHNYLHGSWSNCDKCDDGDYDVCRECHGLGARCPVASHYLSIKKE